MRRLVLILLILLFAVGVSFGQRRNRDVPMRIIQLSEPKLSGNMSLEQALSLRRSVHEFTDEYLKFTEIGQLAWAGQGITEASTGLRTAPSAGAIFPMQLYLATGEGLFIYKPDRHILEEISSDDIRGKLASSAFNQKHVAEAACDIIITGSVKKLAVKYGPKARAFALLEAGHIAQNIQLQAVSLGLASVPVGAIDIKKVNRLCKLRTGAEAFYIVCVGHPDDKTDEITQQKDITSLAGKKALLIIASKNFRDEELFETIKALEKVQVETVIASSRTGTTKGMLGRTVKVSKLIYDVRVEDYDAVVFIGGSGAKEYFGNYEVQKIVRKAVGKRKVLGAICIAPTILARSGVLKGVRATSYPSEKVKLLKEGAKYTGADVEKDGLIITANGPEASAKFGEAIVEALKEKR